MKTVIRNGRIVTAVDDYNADILIEDGNVVMIGRRRVLIIGYSGEAERPDSHARRRVTSLTAGAVQT